jgi:hypothetical protein
VVVEDNKGNNINIDMQPQSNCNIGKPNSNGSSVKNNSVNGVGLVREYHSINSNANLIYNNKIIRYKNIYYHDNGDSIGKKNYSTTNFKYLQNFINSPIYLELQRILINSKLDFNCQLKIEKFLINQGEIFLLEKQKNKNSDINYTKLNPDLLNPIIKSIDDINKLIDNYRDNLKGAKVKYGELKHQFLLFLNNRVIIEGLLGKLLMIITNNQLINSNNIALDVAKNLGITLLYDFYREHLNKNKDYTARYIRSKSFSLKKYIKDNSEEFKKYDDELFLISLGIDLFYLLVEVNLIEIQTITISKDNKKNILVPNKIKFDKLEKPNSYISFSHKNPMIVRPKKYSMN